MAFWGLFLIVIGVGALLDINIWPLFLVVVGTAMLLPVVSGGRRYRHRYDMWWCWWGPPAWERSPERLREGRSAGPSETVATQEDRAWM